MAKRGPQPRDRYLVDLRRAFARSRCQAKYRGEAWQLTWEDWQDFWPREFWSLRGRHQGCLCVTRLDRTLPWSRENCCRMDRIDAVKIGRLHQCGWPVPEHLWQSAITLDSRSSYV